MFKTLFSALITVSAICVTSVLADETIKVYIFKVEGERPRVAASSVDALGAGKMHQLLGEDFIVFQGSATAFAATSNEPVRPIAIPPDIVNPILPLCQCPEDYTEALEQKFGLPEMGKALSLSQNVPNPDNLLNLQPYQFQQLENLIQKKGPVMLPGQ
ncbi:hypothetical protein [Sneathiella glossodoripedis]|uniref:hypothetical protein n=1 Tax=Sneathiella glossodoripedis TaxID=418853 RepID=UPI0004720492|nr:hypothetical protein [Sneathiella glossodoripedis]